VKIDIILGAVALLAAAPLSAQDIPLSVGDKVQFQKVGAAAWVGGRIGAVGDCLTVRFDDEPETADGYMMHSFRAVSGVRIGGETQGWRAASPDQLTRLGGCLSGGPAAAAPALECGSDPSIAKSAIQGFLYGLGMNGSDNPIWGPYAGLEANQIIPVTIGSECARIVAALTAERAKQGAAPDTLPLKGVLDLGGMGYIVSRGVGPAGPSNRMTISTALLSRALELKSYQSFTN
jgi:hypothetical protein